MAETYGGNITVVPGAREFSFHASGTIYEGRLVEVATNVVPASGDYTVKLASENSSCVLGYVDTEWENDDYCVVYTGPAIARLEANTAIAIGQPVAADGSGKIKQYLPTAEEAASGCVVGIALEAITASTFGKVFVNISPNPVPGVA